MLSYILYDRLVLHPIWQILVYSNYLDLDLDFGVINRVYSCTIQDLEQRVLLDRKPLTGVRDLPRVWYQAKPLHEILTVGYDHSKFKEFYGIRLPWTQIPNMK